ncbi:hypothetical protein, partial [Mesorhizobium sp. M0052]|uniref:hypothetical protein n=1 Tax=Mesorhizobium sp. M0052 TaxID=2956863 RepID=UPI00333A0E86
RAQEARSAPSRMTSIMIAHFAELDAHNRALPSLGSRRRAHLLKKPKQNKSEKGKQQRCSR